MQLKLELFSLEVISALENKELLSHFRVHRKRGTIAQTLSYGFHFGSTDTTTLINYNNTSKTWYCTQDDLCQRISQIIN